MIDIFCPHCGFELTEAEIRRFVASLNGRRPKKKQITEGFVSNLPTRWIAAGPAVCPHGRVRSMCLACEKGRK